MPRKMAGSEMRTIDALMVASSVPSVVLDSNHPLVEGVVVIHPRAAAVPSQQQRRRLLWPSLRTFLSQSSSSSLYVSKQVSRAPAHKTHMLAIQKIFKQFVFPPRPRAAAVR